MTVGHSRLLSIALLICFSGALGAAPDQDRKPESYSILGMQMQFWTGLSRDFYQTDLEGRFFRDDLLRGQTSTTQPVAAAQYNNEWVNKPQFNLPVRVYFAPGFLQQLNIEGAYYREHGTITYYGVSDVPLPDKTTVVQLSGFDRSTTSGGLAYNFLGYFHVNPVSLLAVRGGFIRESLDFNYRPLTFSASGIVVPLFNNPYHADAHGLYAGLELTLPIYQKWSATVKVDRSESLRGNMRYERTQIQPASSGFQGTYERADAHYRLARTDRMAAVNYHVTGDFKVTVGYREVVYDASYPGYFSYSISNAGGSLQLFPVNEMVLDYLNYTEVRKERMGNLMFAFEKQFFF